MNQDFAAFTYTTDPVVSFSFTFSYAITAVRTTGGTPADPSWADLSSTLSRRITIATTISADAGIYDFVLKGSLNDSLKTSAQVTIKVYIIDIVNQIPADMTFPVGCANDVIQTITWTLNPNTGGKMSMYSIQYTFSETDGSSVPPWISYASGAIVIDKTKATTPGSHTFRLKGEVQDGTGLTGKYKINDFKVVVY